ncbi:hypothetical protein Droror1_Dr00024257 [Drosera rotundifolia]
MKVLNSFCSHFFPFSSNKALLDGFFEQELLELGDRIGYVSTGLLEEEILRCIGKIKFFASDNETEDEMGKLSCGHVYHTQCIKQWLTRKNACPVCKLTIALWDLFFASCKLF